MASLSHLVARSRSLRTFLLWLLLPLMLLGGCATTNPRDPLEPMNRVVYSFNDAVDKALISPVAEGYRAALPQFLRTGVANIFSNINDVLIALNNLLQGKFIDAISDVGRVVINSTAGIAGFFDVATHFGMEKHNEDFGQTLGYWGVGDGPYLMLPLVGPSNLRDAVARVVDYRTDPITYVRSMRLRNSLWGTRALSHRADLLDTSKILETAALDPYEFLRDAYLQRRRNLVHDGAPPREKDERTELNLKPRADGNPFPRSAGSDTPVGTPFVNAARAEDWTPARAAAQEAAAAPAMLATLAPEIITAPAVQSEPATATPAAAAAPAVTAEPTTPAAAPAAEPQTEIVLPSEPTAAGEAAETQQPTRQRVVRVWGSAWN